MDQLSIECGEGWRQLAESCHEELLAVDPNYVPRQIKEKFGTLRYYYDTQIPNDDDRYHKMNRIVNLYEIESASVCEMCGRVGKLSHKSAWVKTLCAQHFPEDKVKIIT